MDNQHPTLPPTEATPTHQQPIHFSSPQALVIWMQMDSLRVQCGTAGAHANMLNQPEIALIFFTHAQMWEKMRDDFHKKQAPSLPLIQKPGELSQAAIEALKKDLIKKP